MTKGFRHFYSFILRWSFSNCHVTMSAKTHHQLDFWNSKTCLPEIGNFLYYHWLKRDHWVPSSIAINNALSFFFPPFGSSPFSLSTRQGDISLIGGVFYLKASKLKKIVPHPLNEISPCLVDKVSKKNLKIWKKFAPPPQRDIALSRCQRERRGDKERSLYLVGVAAHTWNVGDSDWGKMVKAQGSLPT